ncbi:MAG: 2,3,4,5-tetrahydropyridine-2,6-dicarboxylate N-succinyltransferase [Polyangiaceae bacterium]|nr:2,3,4,5-tetrahydropyridine-2,6-dicarboxylate N-succinyltransferase [Polyangiaceae bacterium]
MPDRKTLIEAASADRSVLSRPEVVNAVESVIADLDKGKLRVASQTGSAEVAEGESRTTSEAEWTTHAWVKQAILLYFAVRKMEKHVSPPFEFYDKVPLKSDLESTGVRVVPGAVARFGAHIESGAILMPSFVNIGAYVGAGTMVDTWATVGSCAQVGRDCHLAGGVGIGGVLEPPGARPVILEDGVFVGSRAIIVEGVWVQREAVIGAGVVLTASTTIIDVSGETPVETKGVIPARSVVIPGTRIKKFPAGEFGVPCALIIGKRSASTDRKVSLNDALRTFSVPV